MKSVQVVEYLWAEIKGTIFVPIFQSNKQLLWLNWWKCNDSIMTNSTTIKKQKLMLACCVWIGRTGITTIFIGRLVCSFPSVQNGYLSIYLNKYVCHIYIYYIYVHYIICISYIILYIYRLLYIYMSIIFIYLLHIYIYYIYVYYIYSIYIYRI